MTNFEKDFEAVQVAERASKSLKEFSDWIFGISIGISTLLITQFDSINELNETFYKLMIILSLGNILYSGINKYFLLRRAVKIDLLYTEMRKITIGLPKDSDYTKNEEFKDKFTKWLTTYMRIELIHKSVNFSVIFATLSIFGTGFFVLKYLI